MKEPKIRFEGFGGEWSLTQVNDILEIRNIQAPKSIEFPLKAFVANLGIIDKGEKYDRSALVSDVDNKPYKRTIFNDFIYSSNNLESGSIGLNKYGNASISPVYSIFFCRKGYDSDFIGRRFVKKDFIGKMVKWRQGVMYGQWRIHEKDFLKIEVDFPAYDEQKEIGRYFQQLDSLIQSTTKKIESLRQIMAASLQSMFPQGGETKPCVRFRGFEEEWEKVSLNNILEERNEKSRKTLEYPLMAFIANKGVAPKGERYDRSALVNDVENKIYKKTEFGDFIYSSNNLETGSIGLNSYGKATISPVYSIFRCKDMIDANFIGRRLVCRDIINEMIKWRQGVVYGQWRIHEKDFLTINILLPSYEEQNKIGAYFSNLDKQITLQTQRLEKLKQIKSACLDNMFV